VIRATLDTNTLASGVIAHDGPIAVLFDRWRAGEFEIAVSDHILEELERTLRKPYFAARLSSSDRDEFLSLLVELAAVVEIAGPIPTDARTLPDNLILATARSAGASYVVSGDRELQRLGEFQGTCACSISKATSMAAAKRRRPRR